MLTLASEIRQGFLCPECHQEMFNMETLQIHFQDRHTKQATSTAKGKHDSIFDVSCYSLIVSIYNHTMLNRCRHSRFVQQFENFSYKKQ
jgi:hypothetical protein